jgi:hypothetical protein
MKATATRIDVAALQRLPLTARSHAVQALDRCKLTCTRTPACTITI